ncbi:DUF2397 family protein [Streptomyces canus]|uniref:DUF2397 family protein n=1 Tax=Streptomyces canus TaxID=58343 RepID=UPI0033A9DF9F
MEGDELHRSPSDEETGRDSPGSGSEAWQRLSAYAYLSAPERLEYVAVMRVFCGTLLADLAAPDVLAKLAQTGGPGAVLEAETLTARLEQLVRWGNPLRSTHTVTATGIAEYQRSRSRYQLSKLGERVQRVQSWREADPKVLGAFATTVTRLWREIAAEDSAPWKVARAGHAAELKALLLVTP